MNLNVTEYVIMSSEGQTTAADLIEITKPLATHSTTLAPQLDIGCPAKWLHITQDLNSALDIHVYGFAVVYILTCIVSIVRLHRLYTFRAGRLMSGFHFKVNMHISTLIFSLLRTVMLCLDPYGSRCRVSPLLIKLLWSLAFPCLAVAFNLLLLLLLETTKLYPNLSCIKHRSLTLIASAVLYTTVLVLKDLLMDYNTTAATVFNILALIIFTIWGILMMLGYFYVAWKIRTSLRTSGSPIESVALHRFSVLLLACGMVGLVTIIMQIFYAISEYGFPGHLTSTSPWVWWCLESVLRLLESAMSCLLMVVASRTDNKRHVQVAPCTTWDWPQMHGWDLEAVPTRPGRPVRANPNLHVIRKSPAHATQSTSTRPECRTRTV